MVHTEKSFWNLLTSYRNQILFTIFLLILKQTDVRLVPNQSENGKDDLIYGWFNKISKKILCVYLLIVSGVLSLPRKMLVRIMNIYIHKNIILHLYIYNFASETKCRCRRCLRGAQRSSFYSHIWDLKWTGPTLTLFKLLISRKDGDIKFWYVPDSCFTNEFSQFVILRFGIDIFDIIWNALFSVVVIFCNFRQFFSS